MFGGRPTGDVQIFPDGLGGHLARSLVIAAFVGDRERFPLPW